LEYVHIGDYIDASYDMFVPIFAKRCNSWKGMV